MWIHKVGEIRISPNKIQLSTFRQNYLDTAASKCKTHKNSKTNGEWIQKTGEISISPNILLFYKFYIWWQLNSGGKLIPEYFLLFIKLYNW